MSGLSTIPRTRQRLMLTYLAIIMVVSLAFSVALYEVSARTIGGGLANQERAYFVNGILVRPRGDRLRTIRETEYDHVQHNLLLRLLFLNLLMLGVGACISDYLAKRSLQPMEEALESQARFTSDAAHELRTPLTAMKTEIEVGLRTPHLKAADAKELLASNLEEVNKLDSLTAALLRLAKTESGDEMWQEVKLQTVLDTAAERVATLAKPKDITVAIAPTPVKVRGDQYQLTELFYVLLENAVKYGRKHTAVNCKVTAQGGSVRIAVADQGIGIKASELPHIFERFYRADQSRSKTQTTGYGLGLSLAQHIARSHRGDITATSTPGKGSIFTVTLPGLPA